MFRFFTSNDSRLQIEKAIALRYPVLCDATSYSDGTLYVEFGGVKGTMTESFDDGPYTVHPSAMVGSKISLVPTFFDRYNCHFSLAAAREYAGDHLAIGDIISVTVSSVQAFGFFAITDYATTLFVPIQDCCMSRHRHASEIVKINESIKVKLSDFDPATFKAKGNLKCMLGEPLELIRKLGIKEGDIVSCTLLEHVEGDSNGYYATIAGCQNLVGIADIPRPISYGTCLGLYVKKLEINEGKIRIKLRLPHTKVKRPSIQPTASAAEKPPKKPPFSPEDRLSPFAIYSPNDYKKFAGTGHVELNYVEATLQNGVIKDLDYTIIAAINEYTVLSASQLFAVLQYKSPDLCSTKQKLKNRLELLVSLKMLAAYTIESEVLHSKTLYYTLDLFGRPVLKEHDVNVNFKQTSASMPLISFKRYLSRNAIIAFLLKDGVRIETLNLNTPIPGLDRGTLSVTFPNGERVLYEISRRYTQSLSGSTWLDSLRERLDAYSKLTSGEFDYLVINCDNEQHMKEAFEAVEDIIKNTALKVLFSHDTLQLDIYNSFLRLTRDDNGEIVSQKVMLLSEKPVEKTLDIVKDGPMDLRAF